MNTAQKLLQSFYAPKKFRSVGGGQTKQQIIEEHEAKMQRAEAKRVRRNRWPNATDRAWRPRRMEIA